LFFRGAPLSQPAHLVFGDDGSNPAGDATISGTLALPLLTFASEIRLGLKITGDLALPALVFSSQVVYFTDTARPLVGQVVARWQDADAQAERVQQRFQDATAQPVGVRARFADALSLSDESLARWMDADRTRREALATRFQDGDPMHVGAGMSYGDAVRGYRPDLRVRYQVAKPKRRGMSTRFQDATRGIAGLHRTRYQDAMPFVAGWLSVVGSGRAINRGWQSRYQDATSPKPGAGGTTPPEPEPCYTPSPHLVFASPWSADTGLVFVCEAHGPGPDPDPETVVVPIRRIYTVINTASLRRVVGNVLIPNTAMSLTIDADSWTWGFTAQVPGAALPDLEPVGGVPVELEATINGVAYRAIVEGISRDRTFGRSDLTITGRGRAAVLDAPYSPVMTFGNAAERTVQQLANDVLTLNGVSLGWDVDAGWKPEDWLVPADVFSHQGTYMSAINAIAADVGAYVQAHRSDKALSVLMRYPAKPWEWSDVTPDFELPGAVVEKEGIVWTDKPNYNRVFVRGMKSGRLGQVTRQGTAGDIEAPMVTAQLGTNAIGLRQRALPVLADVGRQAAVSLRLPVLAETGIIPPGKFVRYVDGGTTRIGLVRSVSAEVQRAEKKLTIWQTIGVETHV
jgi:hypothetical protein